MEQIVGTLASGLLVGRSWSTALPSLVFYLPNNGGIGKKNNEGKCDDPFFFF
jgi:hypothetical protein